ncbi:MarR family winged helix-turn-helix transcriptional regulator [Thermogemmatispora carboxidivorans]|uniref:MarR family winged helix-turn-helix transcriptional regulator n=1 Tax=Thermogemmatispora carboxidivorans TaxID=1382306 RepID=UPI00069A3253|nr:MarR family transcriptional regulator [Thermogemmatispora carboxidivorans]
MESIQPLPRMIGALLRIPFQQTVARVYQRLTEAGYTDLRPTHFVLLQQLRPEGMRVTELASLAQMTKQSMGAIVDYVEERGYIERIPDPRDGRARLVRLTPRGREVERVARAAIAELESEWAQYLGHERFAALRSALQDLVTFIESQGEGATLP